MMTTEETKKLKIGDRLSLKIKNKDETGVVVEINPASRPDTVKIRQDSGPEGIFDLATLERIGTL